VHSSTSSSDPRPGRAWPQALVAAILLFFVCEHLAWSSPRLLDFAYRHTPVGPRGDALLITTGTWLLRREPGPPPVVLLGSSQVREGLDCDVLRARLARPCANLAISAGSPLDLLYISRELRDDLPRTTVVGVFPKILHGRLKAAFLDAATFGSIARSGTWRALSAEQWREVAFGFLMQLSPTLRNKDGLWEMYAFVRDRRAAFRHGRLPDAPHRQLAHTEPQPDDYFAAREGRLNPDVGSPEMTPAQDDALARLLDHERRLGNRVVLVDFPTRPGYEATISPEWRAHRDALMAAVAARGDVRTVTAAELGPLVTSDFLDFTHLGPPGREKVSQRLASILAAAGTP
jgi:hypothetical protein